MRWRKLGFVFNASGQNEMMITGGRAPISLKLSEDLYRIYFGAYDNKGRGRIFSLEIDLYRFENCRNLVTSPVVDIGDIGFFDDNGVIPSAVLRVDDKI